MNLVAVKTQTRILELHSQPALAALQPAGKGHDENDQEDDAEKASSHSRASRVEAATAKDDQQNYED